MPSVIAEIDSFTTKFKALLANGFKATLTLEANEGEIFATLKAGLGCKLLPAAQAGEVLLEPKRPVKHTRSPAYFRRQEKRKLERIQNMKAEEANTAVSAKGNEALDSMQKVLPQPDLAKKKCISSEEPEKLNRNDGSYFLNKNTDVDILTFGFWSEKEISTFEAAKQIRESLSCSFIENKIDVADQIFEICGSKVIDKNEVEVQIKVKKEPSKLKQAVKQIQTRYKPGDSYEISLIRLST